MGQYILSGTVHKVPYRVHWTALLAIPFGWAFATSLLSGSLLAISLLLLVVGHEIGHFIVARFCGLDVFGFEFNILHGKTLFESPEYELELALISWGGVGVQAFLLFLFAPLYALGDILPRPLTTILAPVAAVFVGVNALLIVANLWPKAPFDGENAWKIVPYAINGDLTRFLKARALARSLH